MLKMGAFNALLAAAFSRLSPRRKANFVEFALGQLPELAYSRLTASGFQPSAIVDVGAYQGDWTRLVARSFPNTPVLMIEAQAEKLNYLRSVESELQQTRALTCLLGETEGAQVKFHVMETGSSIYRERSNVSPEPRVLKTRRLDAVLSENNFLQQPLFLKLDVQGAELDILRGGQIAMQNAEVIQLEVALAHYNEGAPQSEEVIAFMTEHDFSVHDICGFIRPDPNCVSQMDVLFVRKTSKLRKSFFTF
jgi:FkbM family methyltransferase